MSTYSLGLFGGFALRDDAGAQVAVRSKKSRCLLAYLALARGQPLDRDLLAGLLWGDRDNSHARHSLSQELYRLRGLFAEDAQAGFQLASDTVGIDAELLEVDVLRFERGVASDKAAVMEEAAVLYTGDLLAGLETGQEGFDDWLRTERERLRDRAIAALHDVVRAQMDGPAERAIESASRLLAIDPTGEKAHRALMELYARSGRRDLALRQYEKCKDVLLTELGIEPDGLTRDLHETINAAPQTANSGAARPRIVDDAPSGEEALPDQPPPLPSKPSIAVLPFANVSGDPNQEHIADAVTEDITMELSRYRDLFVIASHSAFAFKGRRGDVRQIARELGVRYILEGSVRQAGGRVRIGPQLIDAVTGGHVWADRFDGSSEDIFELQDQVATRTAGAVGGGILSAEIESASRQRPENLNAYGLYAQGMGFLVAPTRQGLAKAMDAFSRAIDLEPEYSNAHLGIGWSYFAESVFGWGEDPTHSREMAHQALRRAVELDAYNDRAHAISGFCLVFRKEYELAKTEADRSLELNPNLAWGYLSRSFVNVFSGHPEDGVADARMAIRLSPRDPFMFGFENFVAWGSYMARDYETAAEWASRMVAKYPGFIFGYTDLAAACGQLGQFERANKALKEALRITPDLVETLKLQPFKDPADMEHMWDGLRKAGLEVHT